MPIFDYMCNGCGDKQQDILVPRWDVIVNCPKCGKPMQRLIGLPNVHCFPAEGIHLKHVCPGGKTFHSKTDMKRYAKANNLELSALL